MKLKRMPYWQDGERKLSEKWYAVWVDFSEHLRRLPLYADRKASDELSRKIDRMNQLRASGEMLPPELVRYVETMPPSIRTKLAEWGIISMARAAAGKALSLHLDDWKASVSAKGSCARHVDQVRARVAKAFEGAGFKLWTDISASKLQTHLADMRADRKRADETIDRGISAQTYNFYLQNCKQFCRWMVRDGRAVENPLAHLQGLNVKMDRRHDRRALSPDELRWLLDVTANGWSKPGHNGEAVNMVEAVQRFRMTAAARAMLYRLAVETGLRAGELRSLTRGSFDLEGDEPSVTIAAAYAKNRRQDTLPLRPVTAALLKEHLADKMPHVQAFAVPGRRDVVTMFRQDLADARRAWLESHRTPQGRTEAEQTTFLLTVDGSGHHADFHALRHTFITGLVTGGVNPKVAQTLARHSVITLTMDRYTHLYAGNLSSALDVLPDLSAPTRQTMRATGTDGAAAHLSPDLFPGGEVAGSLMQSDAGNSTEKRGFSQMAQGGGQVRKPVCPQG